MLAKKFRLARRQIESLRKRGLKKNFGNIVIKSLPNRLGYSRFAVNIPATVIKKASDRNRLRRIIFEELSQAKPQGKDFQINLYRAIDEDALRDQIKKICLNI